MPHTHHQSFFAFTVSGTHKQIQLFLSSVYCIWPHTQTHCLCLSLCAPSLVPSASPHPPHPLFSYSCLWHSKPTGLWADIFPHALHRPDIWHSSHASTPTQCCTAPVITGWHWSQPHERKHCRQRWRKPLRVYPSSGLSVFRFFRYRLH